MTSITACASPPLVSEFVGEEWVLVGLFLLESDGRRQVRGPTLLVVLAVLGRSQGLGFRHNQYENNTGNSQCLEQSEMLPHIYFIVVSLSG